MYSTLELNLDPEIVIVKLPNQLMGRAPSQGTSKRVTTLTVFRVSSLCLSWEGYQVAPTVKIQDPKELPSWYPYVPSWFRDLISAVGGTPQTLVPLVAKPNCRANAMFILTVLVPYQNVQL